MPEEENSIKLERSTRKNKLKALCKKLFLWEKETSEVNKIEVENGEN